MFLNGLPKKSLTFVMIITTSQSSSKKYSASEHFDCLQRPCKNISINYLEIYTFSFLNCPIFFIFRSFTLIISQTQEPIYNQISLNSISYNKIGIMYRRDLSGAHSAGQRKKIKHFSYSESDRIGKGYSSIVYRGLNDLTNETIAVKAIDMKGVKDAVSREMLDCEIQALTKIKHPNILKCYDVVRETSHCYIITEYCNEGDLSSFLKKRRRISQQEALKLIKDIVSGFIEMAQRCYLHRDLKLANIFLNDGRAIIADFGFAKKHSNVFEKEKYNVGSPLYMSPQALKKNIYSVKNDIWSIGIMIFELLHGETPWECKTEKELMDKMVTVPVTFRESLSLSEGMKLFIKKCLEVNEEQRMSLNDLKEWNKNNSYESLKEGGMNYLPENLQLQKKICSSKQNKPVLGELTNRMASRSQSSFTYQSKSFRQASSQNPLSNIAQKDNKPSTSTKNNTIEKNNNILIMEINTFRLLYKIYEKLKKNCSQERELINVIGNQVIKRVSEINNIVCPDKENIYPVRSDEYGLTDIKSYLTEETNPSIKKYKSVVKEYHKKYTQEITINPLGRQINSKNLIKEALTKGKIVNDNLSTQEMVMVYWMIEFATLQSNVKKQYLDGVIDPKNQVLSKNYLNDRIKAL